MKLIPTFMALIGLVCASTSARQKNSEMSDLLPFYQNQYGPWLDLLNAFLTLKYPEFPGEFVVTLRSKSGSPHVPSQDESTHNTVSSKFLHERFVQSWMYFNPPFQFPMTSNNCPFCKYIFDNDALVDNAPGYYPETLEAFAEYVTKPLFDQLHDFAEDLPTPIHYEPQVEVKFPSQISGLPLLTHRYWSVAGRPTELHVIELRQQYYGWILLILNDRFTIDPEVCKLVQEETGRITTPETVTCATRIQDMYSVIYKNGQHIVSKISQGAKREHNVRTIPQTDSHELEETHELPVATPTEAVKPTYCPVATPSQNNNEDFLNMLKQAMLLTINLLGAFFIVAIQYRSDCQGLTGRQLVKTEMKCLFGAILWSTILSFFRSSSNISNNNEPLSMCCSLCLACFLQIPWRRDPSAINEHACQKCCLGMASGATAIESFSTNSESNQINCATLQPLESSEIESPDLVSFADELTQPAESDETVSVTAGHVGENTSSILDDTTSHKSKRCESQAPMIQALTPDEADSQDLILKASVEEFGEWESSSPEGLDSAKNPLASSNDDSSKPLAKKASSADNSSCEEFEIL